MKIPDQVLEFLRYFRSLRIRRPEKFDVVVVLAAVVAVSAGLALVIWLVKGPTIVVNNLRRATLTATTGPLSGLPCSDPLRRPIAVMLASDPEARPLSGLRDADLVFEAAVTPNGITRLMAVFQCAEPEEVGSVRSARETFIPLVQGLQAIYAHWGGEQGVLDRLDAGIVDNVDALKYEGSVYYRKSRVPQPHNGFTTLEAIREKADELGYSASVSLDPYPHTTDTVAGRNLGSIVDEITIPGPPNMEVVFRYDAETRTYHRWRGGEPETDRLDGSFVAPSVVIVMQTDIDAIYDQYLDLVTIGQGSAVIYQQGARTVASWHKPSADAMLRFSDAQGETITLTPGQLWIVIQADL